MKCSGITPGNLRVMMIGPYPRSAERLDGGVASATTYLSQSLAVEKGLDLVSVRIARPRDGAVDPTGFGWPIADLSLGKMSLTTLYRRQKSELLNLIERFRPDVVHGQGADIAGFLAVECGVPAVVTVHGLLGECARFQTNPVVKARALLTGMVTEKRSVRRARDLIAISPYVTRYYGTDIRGRVHLIPNAISPAYFRVLRRPERGRLLYAGRISNGKGLAELLQAVERNSRFVSALVLAGNAPDPGYRDWLRGEAQRLGVARKIVFAGLLDEASLLDEFERAEALMLPSFQETAPMVIQQAMAAGIAVIATRVGGIPDQLQDGKTGLLCDAGDIDGIARLIARLLTEASLSTHIGNAAKMVANSTFQPEAVAKATLAVYRGAVSPGRVTTTS